MENRNASFAKQPPPGELSPKNSDLSQASNVDDNGDAKPVKKLPPIKAHVGIAKSPDLKNCKSKIGSLNNIKYTPSGGRIQIQSQKLQWNAKSKIGSLENKEHKPLGGNVKVETRKLEWKTTSRVQSLQNVKHKPGGGNVKIFNESYRDKQMKTQQSPPVEHNEGLTSNEKIKNQKPADQTKTSDGGSLANNMQNLSLKEK